MSLKQMARTAALGAALFLLTPALASAQDTVRIAQGVSALSFLPLWAARALNSFTSQGVTGSVVVVPGGDAAALAALDAGDIDLAAVGSESVLRADAKGQSFEMVYSLMSKVTLQLVVSPALLKRTGVKITDPLENRLGGLRAATMAVWALGGTQETGGGWFEKKAGVNRKMDFKVGKIG